MLGGLYSTSTTLKAAPGVGKPSVGLAGSSSYELEKFERMLKREKIWDLAKEEKKQKKAKDSSTDRRYHTENYMAKCQHNNSCFRSLKDDLS